MEAGGHTWLDAEAADLADAVYAADEKHSSQARALSACKRLYAWLEETERRTDNPTRFLKAPKQTQKLPTLITEAQIENLLAAPDTDTPHGLRDKALLEVMYATGLRVTEAVKLQLGDLDLNRGCIRTIGKGDKLRIVPMGEEAVYWVERYCAESRPLLLKNKICDEVFVSQKRSGISRQLAWMIVKTTPKPPASPRSARTACATLSPPISSTMASICAPYSSCSDTPTSTPPKSTPTSPTSA